MFHCEVPYKSIFDMDKGVYDGQLVLIDDIPKDASLSGEQPTTPLRET